MTWNLSPHPGGTSGIQFVTPRVPCEAHQCKLRLQIGLFFDGTGNNYEADFPIFKHSNVGRLFDAYKDQASGPAFYPIYVPGIGTRFVDIGESKPRNVLGMGIGMGGEERVLYGITECLNVVHRTLTKQNYFSAPARLALCRNYSSRSGWSLSEQVASDLSDAELKADKAALSTVGRGGKGGLMRDAADRKQFLSEHAAILTALIREVRQPKIGEIFFDVFGFSRGAASARVFCNWLLELFQGDRFCGVPATIRFLGIFDTVASVGAPVSAPVIGRPAAGHLEWATADALRVPRRVQNCHHYVAMHENRAAFPVEKLEVLRSEGYLPDSFREYAFPGMHSDVGGGYLPLDQGRGPGRRDADKLSQAPLNRMAEAALAAGVPLSLEAATNPDGTSAFEASVAMELACAEFYEAAGRQSRPAREWLKPYLAWRYQVRDRYARLPASERTQGNEDYSHLRDANAILLEDARLLEVLEREPNLFERVSHSVYDRLGFVAKKALQAYGLISDHSLARERLADLDPESQELYRYCRAAPKTPDALAVLFGDYCHDSYAGFRPRDFRVKHIYGRVTPADGVLLCDSRFGWGRALGAKVDNIDLWFGGTWEPTGYFRYRRHFMGTNEALAVVAHPTETTSA